LTREDGRIDWKLPATVLWQRIRGLSPWPSTFTSWQGKQLKILAAKPVVADEPGRTGSVVILKDKEAGFGVVTGAGVLGIISVQFEGKRAMAASEFVRGQHGLIGTVLPN
jgi:methionyl-tRNA formyltransferase